MNIINYHRVHYIHIDSEHYLRLPVEAAWRWLKV